MSIEYALYCDVCRHLIDASSISISAVRQAAKKQGTLHRMFRKDVCSGCRSQYSKQQIKEMLQRK